MEIESRCAILALALLADSFIGEPKIIWSRIPHPVALMGKLIEVITVWGNRRNYSGKRRRLNGIIGIAILSGAMALPGIGAGGIAIIDLIIVTILLAGKSLADHVRAVAESLESGTLEESQTAIAKIVGRDPKKLDHHGVAKAAIESTAENLSDGIIAPAFYYLCFGLTGILVYKIVNTADSMIGYRTKDFAAFGWGAAKLDDILNLIPARLTGILIVLSTPKKTIQAIIIMVRDAKNHSSPNAGWPESAMAGVLNLTLGGPTQYRQRKTTTPPINKKGHPKPTPQDIRRAIKILWRVIILTTTLSLAIFILWRA